MNPTRHVETAGGRLLAGTQDQPVRDHGVRGWFGAPHNRCKVASSGLLELAELGLGGDGVIFLGHGGRFGAVGRTFDNRQPDRRAPPK